LASILYERLLWGDDPRTALHDLRTQMGLLTEYGHDWASLVAYASLPEDLERQLEEIRVERGYAARWVALEKCEDHLGPVARVLGEVEKGPDQDEPWPKSPDLQDFQKTLAQLDLANRRSQLDLPEERDDALLLEVKRRIQELGYLAGCQKRYAQFLFQQSRILPPDEELKRREEEALRKASEIYGRASRLDPDDAWVGTQHLVLRAALGLQTDEKRWEKLKRSAENGMGAKDISGAWQSINLLELLMLSPEEKAPKAGSEFDRCLAGLKAWAGEEDFAKVLTSTYFQLRRYVDWWRVKPRCRELAGKALGTLCKNFQEPLVRALPLREEEIWEWTVPPPGTGVKRMPSSGPLAKTMGEPLGKAMSARLGKIKNTPLGRTSKIEAHIEESVPQKVCQIHLKVTAAGKTALPVVFFHLHPTFQPSTVRVVPRDNEARLTLRAWGAFTVGVTFEGDDARLELDLAECQGAPSWFSHSMTRGRRKNSSSFSGA
jgi:hypothetical protein